ncbi:hypothetical protein QIS74_04768 [Colletotrichum tabaci]|uniref:Uncharacterized protein n=1 Tax=Colletotrichum tabaci TaxID=1209068 RepID=A0AAV9TJU0_9PEZI
MEKGLDHDLLVNQQVAAGGLLRQCLFMGADVVGRCMVAEARAACYGGSTFQLPLDGLRCFLSDSLEDGETETAVHPLVRKGIVVDLQASHYTEERQTGKDGAVTWIQRELSMLLLFT